MMAKLMAKLMVAIDGESRIEKWEVGRLKSAKKASVALPQEGATVAASLFTWQALDSANRASGYMHGYMEPAHMCSTIYRWIWQAAVQRASGSWWRLCPWYSHDLGQVARKSRKNRDPSVGF